MAAPPSVTPNPAHIAALAPLLDVLALAAQLNHGSVGAVNDAIYRLGPRGTQAGITDMATGGNAIPKAPGFAAHAGFDVATGWGTIEASRFVPAHPVRLDIDGHPVTTPTATLHSMLLTETTTFTGR
ncbi:MAG TPA: hypothetical protein VFX16_15360 [Pseudonocardiaceae bacterium]|nr:hypothetical protein [Pseudonocardiaceae bacterium]